MVQALKLLFCRCTSAVIGNSPTKIPPTEVEGKGGNQALRP